MNCVKIIKMDDDFLKPKKISTHAKVGAAVGAVIGGVVGRGLGGAVIGGMIGYAVGKCLEPKTIEDVLIH